MCNLTNNILCNSVSTDLAPLCGSIASKDGNKAILNPECVHDRDGLRKLLFWLVLALSGAVIAWVAGWIVSRRRSAVAERTRRLSGGPTAEYICLTKLHGGVDALAIENGDNNNNNGGVAIHGSVDKACASDDSLCSACETAHGVHTHAEHSLVGAHN
jgi:hypothetical protein